jgi:predicted nucleotidyltransferase
MLSESKKRFKLSPEEFAVERARGIHEAVHELQRSHPEILGMTLFGSLTKGLSRPDSDVDGFIYVDLQRVAEAELLWIG